MVAVVPGLCATGLATGIVHVLTGPDHLSAIAALSVNVGNFRAFWFGIRWGIGHSIGLVLVGSIFIILENISFDDNSEDSSNDSSSSRSIEVPQRVQNLAECFVGIFMVCLGLHILYGTCRRRSEKNRCHHIHCHCQEQKGELSCESLLEKTESISDYGNPSAQDVQSLGIGEEDDNNTHGSKKILSLCVGIFHGIAGPGGVLGVVPAVKLHNAWHSVVYLGSFCVSSIVTMGCFAATYGIMSAKWSSNNESLAYRMEVFSASLSIVVGSLWLILLYFGILDEIFP